VLERHGGKAVAPRVGFGEGAVPELFRRGKARRFAFSAFLHVDAVDALAVGRVSEADGELVGVVLGLRNAFRYFFIPGFGLDYGELGIAVDENIIGGERFAAPPERFDAPGRDGIFTGNAAALDDAPTGGFEGGVDVLGSGFGFVHGVGF